MAEWKTYAPNQHGVELGDRRTGFISATVVRKPDGSNVAYLDMIRAINRREGIGTNLLRELANEVKKQGVTTSKTRYFV